jgi:drug/metabolite transporter (DMT)-like permease
MTPTGGAPTGSAQQTKIILAFVAIYLVWGSTYLAIKYAVETIPPLFAMGTRSVLAGAVLYLWARARGAANPRREHYPALIAIGAAFFLVGHGLLGWAEQHVASGLAALLVASEPLWVAGFEGLMLKNFVITRRILAGLLLGFVGIILLVIPTSPIGDVSNEMHIIGGVAVLVATLSWSGGAVYSRVARLPGSPMLTAGVQLLFGGSFLLIAGIILGEHHQLQTHPVSLKSALGLLYMVIFGSLVAFNAYVWLLRIVPVTRIATHTYVNPVVAVLIGWLIDGEPITPFMLIATTVIIIAVWLVLHSGSRKPPSVDQGGSHGRESHRPPESGASTEMHLHIPARQES